MHLALARSPRRYFLYQPKTGIPTRIKGKLSSDLMPVLKQLRIDLLTTMFSSKGFTCVHCDLSSPESSTAHDSSLVIKHFMNGDQGSSSHYTTLTAITLDLKTSFRLSGHASFFPPVLYARSAAALIAQAYISSNPVSAMILSGTIPANNAQVSPKLLPTEFPEFNFEPKFPIALLTSKMHLEHLNQNSNRLSQDPNVSLLECEDLESSDAVSKMELWMDELGI
ncbi:unnamed protein product [Mycena citricolor]|uniref:Uncharacterized protein n=1 Tax=Mycena citricolor TaxID=2018698 RepID=A0AAD2JW52_9AGAR|nr:unnamed protein product [Mycena citricolor]